MLIKQLISIIFFCPLLEKLSTFVHVAQMGLILPRW